MKHNQPHWGFELGWLNIFLMTITVLLSALYIYIYIYIYIMQTAMSRFSTQVRERERGTIGVMDIVGGNGDDDLSSKPGHGCLHFTYC